MLKFLVNKMFRNEIKDYSEAHKIIIIDHLKIDFYIDVLLRVIISFPIMTVFMLFVDHHDLLDIILGIMILAFYCAFLIWFIRTFHEAIKTFKGELFRIWYGKYFSTKGKAITKDDFEKVKEKNENLYEVIMKCYASGYCYNVCFSLLKCLEKGEIKFIAAKHNGAIEQQIDNQYCFHVLYINNGWCYDTYTMRQFPVEKVIGYFEAKEYCSFFYEDVKKKTYEQFMKEQVKNFKKWCAKNDCEINLSMFEGK